MSRFPMALVWSLPLGMCRDVSGDYMRQLAESDMESLLFGGARKEDIDSIIKKMDEIQGVRITRNEHRPFDDERAFTMFRKESH